MAVLFVRPSRFSTIPRLVSLVVSEAEADALNFAVQVYAKGAIYFRKQRPSITDEFARNTHLEFADYRNAVDQLIFQIPGIPPPDPWLLALMSQPLRR